MKFRSTPEFRRDVKRLKREHLQTFREVVIKSFVPACDAWAVAKDVGGEFLWPKGLRVSPLRGTSDLWEMTWSFASPDGRATFQLVREEGEWYCLWRRVGDHGVFGDP